MVDFEKIAQDAYYDEMDKIAALGNFIVNGKNAIKNGVKKIISGDKFPVASDFATPKLDVGKIIGKPRVSNFHERMILKANERNAKRIHEPFGNDVQRTYDTMQNRMHRYGPLEKSEDLRNKRILKDFDEAFERSGADRRFANSRTDKINNAISKRNAGADSDAIEIAKRNKNIETRRSDKKALHKALTNWTDKYKG